MNLHINKFNSNIQKKLRTLKGENPKEYWKVINSLDRNSDESNINLETLYNFFKDINENTTQNKSEGNEINIDISNDDEIRF